MWNWMLIRDRRMYTLLAADAALAALALVVAFFIRFFAPEAVSYVSTYWLLVPLAAVLRVVILWLFGIYRWVWYYVGVKELLTLGEAVSFGSLALGAILYLSHGAAFPRSILIIDWLLNLYFIGGMRFFIRIWREETAKRKVTGTRRRRRILVVGAGDAGEAIISEVTAHPQLGYQPVGCVDDDPRKQGQSIHGIPVLGKTRDIPGLVDLYSIEEIVVAIPSAPSATMRQILDYCQKSKAKFRTLPGMPEIIGGQVSISQIREVAIDDLLGREPYNLDVESIASYLSGARVLLTGAGGSIGSELSRQMAVFKPARLTLLDWTENDLFDIQQEMLRRFPGLPLDAVVADITNQPRMEQIMAEYRPQVVFHAAARKHVPLMEHYPEQAVLTNIMGTKILMDAAHSNGVGKFVFISSDKAVNPTSVMGATKRVGELMARFQARHSATRFVAVRFGNVLGSRGSVVPLFKRQIAEGGPVTVTDPEIIRYFMTISEAVQLVIQAGALGEGGELFVLDMGKPVKILDLARDLIRLSGMEEKDIQIKFTGLRPGEKLFEELFTSEEHVTTTRHEKIMVAQAVPEDGDRLAQAVESLCSLAFKRDDAGIRQKLRELIPSYQPGPSPVATSPDKTG